MISLIRVPRAKGKDYGVFGLGSSGEAALRALAASGARIWAWDDKLADATPPSGGGVTFQPFRDWPWEQLEALVLAPGVPLTHPTPHGVVAAARTHGVKLIGDMELFAQAVADAPGGCKPAVAAITGSNGKSTTTALLGHLLRAAGRPVQVGGNIGEPVLALEPMRADLVYVLEVSSFQLDLCWSFAPDVAVFLNLSPDHLDRHGDLDGYVRAKKRIFQAQGPSETAIVGVDDPISREVEAELRARPGGPAVAPVGVGRIGSKGVFALDGALYAPDIADEPIASLVGVAPLAGAHNHQNAAAAAAAALTLGLTPEEIAAGLRTFQGLAHRMETVAEARGVRFINDSKATNTDAASKALAAQDGVYWIAGGRAKGEDFSVLRKPAHGRVRAAWFIGEAAGALAAVFEGEFPVTRAASLDDAVAGAAEAAFEDRARLSDGPPGVVLLSPACASYDQFKNFEHRGEVFRKAAQMAVQLARAPTP